MTFGAREWKTIAGAGFGAALLGLLTGTAVADDALKLRELSPNGADACFGRVYDAAHLKAQRVTNGLKVCDARHN